MVQQRTLSQLDAELDRFHAGLLAKVAADPDLQIGDDVFLMACAMDTVTGPFKAHVHDRIACILDSLGLIPSD